MKNSVHHNPMKSVEITHQHVPDFIFDPKYSFKIEKSFYWHKDDKTMECFEKCDTYVPQSTCLINKTNTFNLENWWQNVSIQETEMDIQ